MTYRIFLSFLLLVGVSWVSAQKKAVQLRRSDPDAFSMILLSDPQNYVKFDYNQPVFELMTAWIADNSDSLNIKAVLCTGDLVDQNECLVPPFPRFGNLTSRQQWEFVSHAFQRLDNQVPYVISTGNHDYGYTRAENGDTHFPEYFHVERNCCWEKSLVAVCNNRSGIPTLENAAFEFSDRNWGKMLVITLEFAPRDEVLSWAGNLAASEKFSGHRIIVLTHSYLAGNNQLIEKENYRITPANSGLQIWQKLIWPSANIRLVICGHYAKDDESFEHNVGFRSDRNFAGKEVHQMMFNAQALGGGMSGNGGDGWLRILEFLPDGKTIRVKTYSPLFGFSPSTRGMAWRKEKYDQFTIF